MAPEDARDARRRRILNRGTDRLAYITGQTRSLPPSAVDTPSLPSSEGGGGEVEELVPGTVGPAHDGVVTGNELPKCEPSSAAARDAVHRSAAIESITEHEKSRESVGTVQHNDGKIEPVTGHGSYDQVVSTEPQRGRRQAHEIFTAKRISSSISASENIRMLFATFIALLVVLSYFGYPLGGEAVGSIISFRPIYLVLLTDASLVVGILLTTNWEEKDEVDAGRTGEESTDWTDQMGKALELVLVFHKAASAAFMDCCLCAIIIICGVSFSAMPGS